MKPDRILDDARMSPKELAESLGKMAAMFEDVEPGLAAVFRDRAKQLDEVPEIFRS